MRTSANVCQRVVSPMSWFWRRQLFFVLFLAINLCMSPPLHLNNTRIGEQRTGAGGGRLWRDMSVCLWSVIGPLFSGVTDYSFDPRRRLDISGLTRRSRPWLGRHWSTASRYCFLPLQANIRCKYRQLPVTQKDNRICHKPRCCHPKPPLCLSLVCR